MVRAFVLTVIIALSMSLAYCDQSVVAESADDNAAMMQEEEGSVCLLCGMKMKAGEGVSVEYEGKTYSFCSQECADMFKKDPKAMLEKMSTMKMEPSKNLEAAMDQPTEAGK